MFQICLSGLNTEDRILQALVQFLFLGSRVFCYSGFLNLQSTFQFLDGILGVRQILAELALVGLASSQFLSTAYEVLEARHTFSLLRVVLLVRIVSFRSFFFSSRWSILPRFSCSLSYVSTAAVAASIFACVLGLSKLRKLRLAHVHQLRSSCAESSVCAAAACALR